MADLKKLKVINRDMIKYIIISIMFLGHFFAWINIGDEQPDGLFADVVLWQRIFIHLSLLTPPVMFFFIADGFHYTRSRKKYAQRLLIFALITQVPYYLLWYHLYGWWQSNVIFTLFFGLLALIAWFSSLKLWQRIALVVLCTGATAAIVSEWFVFGVLLIFGLQVFRERPKARLGWYSAVWIVYLIIMAIPMLKEGLSGPEIELLLFDVFDFTAAYLLMTVFYNGKKGSHPVFSKWFFYIFYPAHILLVVLVKYLIK